MVTQRQRHAGPGGEAADDVASTDSVLARLAARQHGVITRRQALAAGVGAEAIRDRVRRGALHPVHRGVYRVGHPVPAPLACEQAALLAVGSSAYLARRTAARLWGLLPPCAEADIEILLVGRQVRRRRGIAVRRAAMPPAGPDVRSVGGLPVLAPARTVVDLAAELEDAELERIVHEAQVLRVASAAAVGAALARAGPVPGATRLRRVLDGVGGGATRSEAERELRKVVRAARLPAPHLNVRIGGYEVDALWPRERLVVEVDGFAAHGTRRAFERDRRRDMELQTLGYRVVRVTWRQLTQEQHALVARLAVLLATTSHGDRQGLGV